MIRDNSEEEYSATPEIPSLPNRISPLKFNQPNNSSNNVIELGDTSEEEEEEVLEELILKRREFLTPPRNLNQGGQIASGSGLNQNNNTINKNNNQIQQRNNNLNSSGIKPIVSPFTTTSTSNNTSTSKGKGKGKAQVIELSDSDDEFTPKAVNKKVFNNDKGPVVLSSDDEGLPLAPKQPRQKRKKSISSSSTSASGLASTSTTTTKTTTKKVEQMTISDSDDELPDRRIVSPFKLQAAASKTTAGSSGSGTIRRLSSASASASTSSNSNSNTLKDTLTTPRPSNSTSNSNSNSTITKIELSNSNSNSNSNFSSPTTKTKKLELKNNIEFIKKGGLAILVSDEEVEEGEIVERLENKGGKGRGEKGGGGGDSSEESESLPGSLIKPPVNKSEKSKGKEKEKEIVKSILNSNSMNPSTSTIFKSNQSPSKLVSSLSPPTPLSLSLPLSLPRPNPIPTVEKSTPSQKEAEKLLSTIVVVPGQSGLVTLGVRSLSPSVPIPPSHLTPTISTPKSTSSTIITTTKIIEEKEDVIMKRLTSPEIASNEVDAGIGAKQEKSKGKGKERESMSLSPFTPPPADSPKLSSIPIPNVVQENSISDLAGSSTNLGGGSNSRVATEATTTEIKTLGRPSSPTLHTTTTITATTFDTVNPTSISTIDKGKGKAMEPESEVESPTTSTQGITESLALVLKVDAASPPLPPTTITTSNSNSKNPNQTQGEIIEAKEELTDNSLPPHPPIPNRNQNQEVEIIFIDSDSDYISDDEVLVIEPLLPAVPAAPAAPAAPAVVREEKMIEVEAIVIDDDSDFEEEGQVPIPIVEAEVPQFEERQAVVVGENRGEEVENQEQVEKQENLEEDIEKITLSDQELSPTPPPFPLPLPPVQPQLQAQPPIISQLHLQQQQTQSIYQQQPQPLLQPIQRSQALPPPMTSSPAAKMTARKSTGGRAPSLAARDKEIEVEIISDDSEPEQAEEGPLASTSNLIDEVPKRRDTARKSTGGRAPLIIRRSMEIISDDEEEEAKEQIVPFTSSILDSGGRVTARKSTGGRAPLVRKLAEDISDDQASDDNEKAKGEEVSGIVAKEVGMRSNEMSTTPDDEEEEGFADEEAIVSIKIPHPLSEKNRALEGAEEEEEERVIISPRKSTARKSAGRAPIIPRSEPDSDSDEGFADDPREDRPREARLLSTVGGNSTSRPSFGEVITIDSSEEEEDTQGQQEGEDDDGEGFADEEPTFNRSNGLPSHSNDSSPNPARQYSTARKSTGNKSPLIQLQLRQQQLQQNQNHQFIRRSSPEWHANASSSAFNEEGMIDLSRSDTESGHSGPSDHGQAGGEEEDRENGRRRNARRRARNFGNSPPVDFTSNKKRRLENGHAGLQDEHLANGDSSSLPYIRPLYHRLMNKPRPTYRKSAALNRSSNGGRLKVPNVATGGLNGASSSTSSFSERAESRKIIKRVEEVYVPATEEEMQEFKDLQMRLSPHDRQIGGPAYEGEFTTDLLDEMGRYKAKATAQKNLDGSCLTQTFQHMMEEVVITEVDPSKDIRYTVSPRVHGKGPFSPEFEFIFTFRVIYDEKLKLLPIESPGCDCEGRCQDNKDCSCRTRQTEVCRRRKNDGHSGHVGFAYDSNTRINKEVLECADAIWECNASCGCGVNCINRQVGNRTGVSVDIFDTGVCGWGVRNPLSSTTIKRGTMLAVYSGELLDAATSSYRETTYNKVGRNYLFALDFWNIAAAKREAWDLANPELAEAKAQARVDARRKKGKGKGKGRKGRSGHKKQQLELSSDDDSDEEASTALFTVDAFHYGNWTRYVNHSCTGYNVKVTNVYVDDARLDAPLLCFVAWRDIQPGKELKISYSQGEDDPIIDTKVDGALADYQRNAKKARDESAPSSRCYCMSELCRGVMFRMETDEYGDEDDTSILAPVAAVVGAISSLAESIADATISAVANFVNGGE